MGCGLRAAGCGHGHDARDARGAAEEAPRTEKKKKAGKKKPKTPTTQKKKCVFGRFSTQEPDLSTSPKNPPGKYFPEVLFFPGGFFLLRWLSASRLSVRGTQ
jgi:hypothetical protein